MKTKATLCWLVLLFVAGCATPPVEMKPSHPYGADLAEHSSSWHHLRLRWHWPEGEGPDWPLDLLAADRIFSGIIGARRESLPLWRFHRRAARDPAGHQFSFIFYSSDAVADGVRDAVANHAVARRLVEHGLLEEVYMTSPDRPSDVSATSDSSWPDELQAAWPMFIMGVSQTWLGLIEIYARGADSSGGDLEDEVARYSKVGDELDELWLKYAQHGFFHHLSGLFGYQPVLIRKHIRF